MTTEGLTLSTFVAPRRFAPALPAGLATVTVASIATLVAFRLAGGGPAPLELLLQAALVISFSLLTVVDLRAATAIALFELGLAGAGGQWTMIAGSISGRNFLDGALVVGAAYLLAQDWRRGVRPVIGSYGLHALGLAAVMTVIWFPLGLLDGNKPGDVLGDGNGVLFLVFVVVPLALMRRLRGSWLRQCLYRVCAANAVLTGALIAISASGLVSLRPTLESALIDNMMFGGTVGYMPNGAYRLYLGSGVYLLVGLALCTWRLLERPRQPATWALYGLLWADVVASYTRGFWLGAVVAAGIVLVLGAQSWRRPVAIGAATLGMFLAAGVVGLAFGFSLSNYIFERASTIVLAPGEFGGRPGGAAGGPLMLAALPPSQPLQSQEPQSGGPQSGTVPGTGDRAGEFSNQMRSQQAKVLLEKFRTRPVLGYGFGSIASAYRYGDGYSYELTYLSLLFKTGIVGLLLFLSFPLRLVAHGVRVRLGRLPPGAGVSRREASVALAVVTSILLIAATNPYLLAAFGLCPIVLAVAWFDRTGARAG